MSFASAGGYASRVTATRPMVQGLFVASCLLSLVSWYTTEQGMALYLSGWFAVLASLGVQTALVLVAWLIGFTKARRALLVGVYIITAVVSIAFSYASLYTWFSSKERPVAIERKLYDKLNQDAASVQEVLGAAAAEEQKHVLALEELTAAEKTHGHISRAQDADPYLSKVRAAVAAEAQTYAAAYHEGAGEGVRYTAFDRYTKMARQSLERLQASQKTLADFRAQLKPMAPTEKQLRDFQAAYDTVPWTDVEQSLHAAKFQRPAPVAYADFVDKSANAQEDLLIAFQELVSAPTGRHIFAFLLAAFIDIIVFLLAFASGPYFFGSSEHRWVAASAALDGLDQQVFARDFLRKLTPSVRGMARADSALLTPGEHQFCLLLVSKDLAAASEEDGRIFYLIDPSVHESMLDGLASQGFPMRAAARPVA